MNKLTKLITFAIMIFLVIPMAFAANCLESSAKLIYIDGAVCDENGVPVTVNIFPNKDDVSVSVSITDSNSMYLGDNISTTQSIGDVPLGQVNSTSWVLMCKPNAQNLNVVFTIEHDIDQSCTIDENLNFSIIPNPNLTLSKELPETILFNQSFNVTITTENTGEGSAKVEIAQLGNLQDLESNDLPMNYTQQNVSTEPTKTEIISLRAPSCVDYGATLDLDYYNTNDKLRGSLQEDISFSVIDPLKTASLTVNNNNPTEGNTITFTAAIENMADYNVTGFNVSFYKDNTLIETVQSIDTISVGETRDVSITWSTSGKLGIHTFEAYPISEMSGCDRNHTTSSSVGVTVKEVPAPPTASAGGGGGGGSIISTLDLKLKETFEEQALTVQARQDIEFDFKGESHHIKINGIYDDYIELTIKSDPITIQLNVGETKQLDVNANGLNDLEVTLIKIVNRRAELKFKVLQEKLIEEEHEPVKEETAVEEEPTTEEEQELVVEEEKQEGIPEVTGAFLGAWEFKEWAIATIVVILIILLTTVIMLTPKKKKPKKLSKIEQLKQWRPKIKMKKKKISNPIKKGFRKIKNFFKRTSKSLLNFFFQEKKVKIKKKAPKKKIVKKPKKKQKPKKQSKLNKWLVNFFFEKK